MPSPPLPLLVQAWLPVALAVSGIIVGSGGDPGALAVASLGVGVFLLLPVWAGLAASARRAVELGVPFERCYEAPGAEVTLQVGRQAALALCRRATSAAARSMALADGPDAVRAAVSLDAAGSVPLRLRVVEVATGRSRVAITGGGRLWHLNAVLWPLRTPSFVRHGQTWRAVLDVERWLREHGPAEATP